MKKNIIYRGIFVALVVVVILDISFIHAGRIVTIENEKKVAPEAYIKKDQPTAIYIEGKPEPVLRIEDLPKEFPPHIQHLEGAPFPDNIFNLASLSSDGQRIAFTCGYIHEWVGVYELKSKKVHVTTWLFDTHVKHILWSPNSKCFAYAYVPPRGDHVVAIIGFKQSTGEPYLTNHWSSLDDYDVDDLKEPRCILIEDLEWSKDSKSIAFEIQKCKMEALKLIKIEDAPVDTITLNAVAQEKAKETPKKKKVKRTKDKTGPQVYIKKDQPTAIYIEGNPEPVLRIEDLPKEFPPHIQHLDGAPFPDNIFNLASLSPDGQRIAFTCGYIHEWVGVYELESKNVHVITWLFDTHVKQILWSPNSKCFAYAYVPPRGDHVVAIIGFKQSTGEPYLTNHWSSLDDYDVDDLKEPRCILIEDLEWSKDSKSIAFEIQKCKMEALKLIKMEDAPVDTITLNAIKEDIIVPVGKKRSKVVVTYMGSVSLDSSLADLVPKEDRKMVERKENWLGTQVDPRAHHQMAVSENGRYKILKSFFSETAMEDSVEAIFVDGDGQQLWKGTTGASILVSNNGKNFAAMNPIGGPICFYDLTSSSEPLNCIDECSTHAFSKDGQYFVCANGILSLLNADGSILWQKNTGTPAHNKLAISEDGSYIVMVSNAISGGRTPVITDKEPEVEKQRAKEQFLFKKERPKKKVRKKPRSKEMLPTKTEEDTSSRVKKKQTPPERNIYLSFLRKDGSLIEQFPVSYHIIRRPAIMRKYALMRKLAISGDGNYTAASIDSTLLFFRTETGVLLWKYEFPDAHWLIISVSISKNAEILALGVRRKGGSQRYVYLIDRDGNEIGHFPVRANFRANIMGAVVCFSEDYEYLMVGSPDRKYIYKLDY